MNPYPNSPAHVSAYRAGVEAARRGVSARYCPYWDEHTKAFRKAWFAGRYDYLKGEATPTGWEGIEFAA